MRVTQKSKRLTRLNNVVFVLLFLTLISSLAWLSGRYQFHADWTANNRNTLSDNSVLLLERLEGELRLTAFAIDGGPMKKHIADLTGRYQRHKSDITLAFINPDVEPEKVRELGIGMEGDVLVEYQGRSEVVSNLTEQEFTNVLQRLSRSAERWLVFIEGHGERSVFGQANFDYQTWAQALKSKGFQLMGLNLASDPLIPDNTSVLVLAGPQASYLPGELEIIESYIARGGAVLWLMDTDGLQGLEAVADQLGVAVVPGVIVDPTTQLFSIGDPTFAIVGEYGIHPLTRDFDVLTIYPGAVGLHVDEQDEWQAAPFLITAPRSWSETGEIAGEISFDEVEDVSGPLTISLSLTRDVYPSDHESVLVKQRVVVVGDADFLSNAYVGNGGNLDMGMSMVNWLSNDDQLINIPGKTAQDSSLDLTEGQLMWIAAVFLFILPATFLASGVWVWLRRRKA